MVKGSRATDDRTRSERVADRVASHLGSWKFVLTQTLFFVAWMILNGFLLLHAWDAYPFILLNLVLSFQAAFTGPIIMLSQNRQAAKDRDIAEQDFHLYQDSLAEIQGQNAEILKRLDANR